MSTEPSTEPANPVEQQLTAYALGELEDSEVGVVEALLASDVSARREVEAVRALTKAPGESRLAAGQRAAENAIARNVKLADVADNMNLTRLRDPGERDHARLKEYEQVRALLLAHGAR